MNKFEEVYLQIINESRYSKQYITSLEREEQDRANQMHHFLKQIDNNPQMLKDPEVISRLANCWYLLPYDKYQEYKPLMDEFYKSLKRG